MQFKLSGQDKWLFTVQSILDTNLPARPVGGVVAPCSAYDLKVVGSNPGSALLIPEVNVVDIQLRGLLGLCSLLVHAAECAGNRILGLNE